MKESLNALCENFLASSETIYKQKGFKFTSSRLMPMCAYIYATSGRPFDSERLQAALKLADKNAGGIFSGLRSTMLAPLACTLALSDDPEKVMADAVENLGKLKKTFKESKYLGLAALLLQKIGTAEEFDTKVSRAKVIYDCLKTRHMINTDCHDTLMVNIVAYSEKPVETIIDEIETIYTELKKMTSGEYAQTCSLILTCSDKPAKEKYSRMKELYEELQIDKKNKYSNGAEIVVLSALSLLDIDVETLKNEIMEASELLSKGKQYKGLITTYGKYARMMHAAMLVMADNMTEEMNVLATAAIYMSCFYLCEIEESETAAIVATT